VEPADTVARSRAPLDEVSRRLKPLIEGGVVATTASLDAEALYSARGPAEYEQLRTDYGKPTHSDGTSRRTTPCPPDGDEAHADATPWATGVAFIPV
jgi:hypothetical protein